MTKKSRGDIGAQDGASKHADGLDKEDAGNEKIGRVMLRRQVHIGRNRRSNGRQLMMRLKSRSHTGESMEVIPPPLNEPQWSMMLGRSS